jgi:hypothetical protein
MQENVGRTDQALRFVTGPALIALGLTALGGLRGRLLGLATTIAGVLVTESAITRTCPVNHLAGIDTREPQVRAEDASGQELDRVPHP